MSDEAFRALERRWRETGAPADEAAWLLARARAGELPEERLTLAAWCGHEAAALALGRAPELPPVLEELEAALRAWTALAGAVFALTLLRQGLPEGLAAVHAAEDALEEGARPIPPIEVEGAPLGAPVGVSAGDLSELLYDMPLTRVGGAAMGLAFLITDLSGEPEPGAPVELATELAWWGEPRDLLAEDLRLERWGPGEPAWVRHPHVVELRRWPGARADLLQELVPWLLGEEA